MQGALPELCLGADAQGCTIQLQRRRGVAALHIPSEFAPVSWLRQPARAAERAETKPGRRRRPGDRHPASVSPKTFLLGALPGGVSPCIRRQVDHLGKPELFALVDVGAARQGQHEHARGARAAQAEAEVGRPGEVRAQAQVERVGVGKAHAGGVAHGVVVRKHPGARCAHDTERLE